MKIVPAASWRRERWGRLTPLKLPVGELWVHHGAAGRPTLATLRSYERFHVRSRGWQALGYCYAITGDGTIYEGRGLHQGAHTSGRNDRSIGVLLVGDWTSGRVPEKAVVALAGLTRSLFLSGALAKLEISGGHRDAPGQSTTCPGSGGMDAIRRARASLTVQEDAVKKLAARLRAGWAAAVDAGLYSDGTQHEPVTRAELAYALYETGVLRDGGEMPVGELADELDALDPAGRRRSLVHVLREYRHRAERLGVSGNNPTAVANGTLDRR